MTMDEVLEKCRESVAQISDEVLHEAKSVAGFLTFLTKHSLLDALVAMQSQQCAASAILPEAQMANEFVLRMQAIGQRVTELFNANSCVALTTLASKVCAEDMKGKTLEEIERNASLLQGHPLQGLFKLATAFQAMWR